MILPLLLALIAFAALLFTLLPLLRGVRPAPDRAEFDQAVYRDQLRELDRDIARGVLSQAEARGARLEIQRRLLAADAPAAPAGTRRSRSPIVAVAVGAVVAAGSVGLYLDLGTPGLADMPYASRQAGGPASQEATDMRQAVARLAERLKAEPDNPDGWLLYARATTALADWDTAADAFRRAIALGRGEPDVLASYGEVLVMRAEGAVTPAAREQFAAALKADPRNNMARFYLAVAAGQEGEPRKAIDQLQALAGDLPADAPVRPEIARRIAGFAQIAGIPAPPLVAGQTPAAPGPDAETGAAAARLPEGERKAMVEGMVARLAARMEAEPGDAEGWLRLGRAYAVLGQADKAADAYGKAADLRPDDVSIPLRAAEALLNGHKPTDRLPARAVSLLRQVEAKAPDEPIVLWYLGLNAAQDRKPDIARGYWERLLAKMPPDAPDTRMVKTAIEALKGG